MAMIAASVDTEVAVSRCTVPVLKQMNKNTMSLLVVTSDCQGEMSKVVNACVRKQADKRCQSVSQ